MSEEKFRDFVKERMLSENDSYLGNALAGETGEVCNVLKRFEARLLDDDFKSNLDKAIAAGIRVTLEEHLKEELSDVLFYLTAIAQKHGYTLKELREHQHHKMIGRSISYERMFKK